jgi:methionyl aminopeptidase
MSTLDIDIIAEKEILQRNATPTFKGLYGFPRNVCISVNEELIHGIPKKSKIIKNGDLVTIDMGVTYNEMIVDAAFSLILGNSSKEKKLINKITEDSLLKVCSIIKEGTKVYEIGKFINDYAKNHGYHVIKDFTGHGCGKQLHEDPIIPNYYNDIDFELKENMIICIEPMFMTDSDNYLIDKNDN